MSKKRPTYAEFVRAQKRADCIVCKKIPEKLRREIRDLVQNQRHNATVATAIVWLKEAYGITITRDQWRSHAHGGHTP